MSNCMGARRGGDIWGSMKGASGRYACSRVKCFTLTVLLILIFVVSWGFVVAFLGVHGIPVYA